MNWSSPTPQHRRPARWVRAEQPPARMRAAAAWVSVVDWLQLVWANLTAGDAKPARRGPTRGAAGA